MPRDGSRRACLAARSPTIARESSFRWTASRGPLRKEGYVSTQTRETSTKTTEERLGQVRRKIDQAKAKADSATQEAKARVGHRIDDLEARKTKFQAQIREAREADDRAWEDAYAELTLELDEADAELAVIDAQLEAEFAADQAAYAAAVQSNLDAWNAYLDAMQARADADKESVRNKFGEAVSSVKQKKAAADQRLKELRQSSGEAWTTKRLGMNEAIGDLDRSAQEAASKFN